MFDVSSGRLTRLAIRALDSIAKLTPRPQKAEHLTTGRRGEEEAYFHLRGLGYVMVARNFRSPRRRGEIDLIGWEKDVLCFVEVKTRTSRAVMPAEAAVDEAKRRELVAVAREYLRRVPDKPAVRFDILSIYLERGSSAPEITLFKNAFSMQ
jgi:putative endonuclease